MNTPLYRQEVTKLLASLDAENNQEQEPETEIPDTKTSDTMQDIYVYIVREREEQDNTRVIDSVAEDTIAKTPEPKKYDPPFFVAYAIGFMYVLLVLSCLVLQVYLALNPPIATITIIPKSQKITLTGTLQLGRLVSPISLSQTATAPTTGKGHQIARSATGTLTFYNGSFSTQTVYAGTVYTANNGVQVVTDSTVTIPPDNPPMNGQAATTAYAITPGVQGNIPALAINGTVSNAVFVKNLRAFTGGQDERYFQTVTKKDIATVVTTLETTLTPSMQGALQGQLHTGEALQQLPCTPAVTADHHPGDETTQVKVTVSETCSAIAYNTQQLAIRVTQLLTHQALRRLGTGYSLIPTVQVTVTQGTLRQQKTATITFIAQGTWVYAIDNIKQQHIKTLITGKTRREALQLLSSLPGIEKVSTSWDENTKLPKNPGNIYFVVMYIV